MNWWCRVVTYILIIKLFFWLWQHVKQQYLHSLIDFCRKSVIHMISLIHVFLFTKVIHWPLVCVLINMYMHTHRCKCDSPTLYQNCMLKTIKNWMTDNLFMFMRYERDWWRGKRRIIRNRMWIWLSSFIIKEDTGIVQ